VTSVTFAAYGALEGEEKENINQSKRKHQRRSESVIDNGRISGSSENQSS